jgi:hypothetical protein
MRRVRVIAVAALCLLSVPLASAQAGVFIGVGFPGPYYRPCYRPYYGPRVYVAPAPVYVAPAPVYVTPAPAPVYMAPAPTVVQVPGAQPPAPPPPVLPSPPPAN